MGGKNPAIIFDDCNYSNMLNTIINSSFSNQGQICLCSSRLLIHSSIYTKFKSDLIDSVSKLKIGDPNEIDTEFGAISSKEHYDKILNYIKTDRDGSSIINLTMTGQNYNFKSINPYFDNNNPIFTQYSVLFNYELQAPGTSIMSTIPNGGYAMLTGTSMATPLVAGGVALYKQQKPEDSGELMTGTLINTSTPNIDFLSAVETEPYPLMAVMLTTTRDTINNQNGNGFIDAFDFQVDSVLASV